MSVENNTFQIEDGIFQYSLKYNLARKDNVITLFTEATLGNAGTQALKLDGTSTNATLPSDYVILAIQVEPDSSALVTADDIEVLVGDSASDSNAVAITPPTAKAKINKGYLVNVLEFTNAKTNLLVKHTGNESGGKKIKFRIIYKTKKKSIGSSVPGSSGSIIDVVF